MNLVLLLIQIVVQIGWGIACFLYSPHNIILSLLNVGLVVISIVAHMAGDNEELLFQKLYLASWVIPGFILLCASLAGLVETQNMILQQVGVASVQSPIEGSSTQYTQVFWNFLVSQLIPPFFHVVNWGLNVVRK